MQDEALIAVFKMQVVDRYGDMDGAFLMGMRVSNSRESHFAVLFDHDWDVAAAMTDRELFEIAERTAPAVIGTALSVVIRGKRLDSRSLRNHAPKAA